jgi:hypothetical protein
MNDFTYGLVAVVKDPENEELLKVLAFAGYEQEPTQENRDEVLQTLNQHPDFSGIDFRLIDATEEMISYFNRQQQNNDSTDTSDESNS